MLSVGQYIELAKNLQTKWNTFYIHNHISDKQLGK